MIVPVQPATFILSNSHATGCQQSHYSVLTKCAGYAGAVLVSERILCAKFLGSTIHSAACPPSPTSRLRRTSAPYPRALISRKTTLTLALFAVSVFHPRTAPHRRLWTVCTVSRPLVRTTAARWSAPEPAASGGGAVAVPDVSSARHVSASAPKNPAWGDGVSIDAGSGEENTRIGRSGRKADRWRECAQYCATRSLRDTESSSSARKSARARRFIDLLQYSLAHLSQQLLGKRALARTYGTVDVPFNCIHAVTTATVFRTET